MEAIEKAVVKSVLKNSIACDAGIEAGDVILSVSGVAPKDILEYKFLTADASYSIVFKKPNGDVYEVEIENDEYEELGIEFENPLISTSRSCQNKCIFCFIDQLPKGMRKPLYFKDDDTRLSFLQGNYVTLTNISDEDLQAIVKMRISPINVSVHTTDSELRKMMLGNKKAGKIMNQLRMLCESGIRVNCQIVLVKGVNDGENLEKTISDLASFYPNLNSVSVVPVGISRHRDGLYPLEPFTKSDANAVISLVNRYQNEFLKKLGSRFLFLADEFYLLAEKELPKVFEYEDFSQFENGVGLLSLFLDEFYKNLGTYGEVERTVSIATGVLAEPFIKKMADELKKRSKGLKINVYKIINNTFGEKITVSGLICAKDIIEQLKGKELGEELLISASMLRGNDEIFLDDLYIKDVERELGVKVVPCENDGAQFIQKIIGGNDE